MLWGLVVFFYRRHTTTQLRPPFAVPEHPLRPLRSMVRVIGIRIGIGGRWRGGERGGRGVVIIRGRLGWLVVVVLSLVVIMFMLGMLLYGLRERRRRGTGYRWFSLLVLFLE